MTLIYLLVLITQSLAIKFSLPAEFGGKTQYSDQGWMKLIKQIAYQGVAVGRSPMGEVNIATEPTCFDQYVKCSTTYFGKQLAMDEPETIEFWVKWHEDADPFICEDPKGCFVTADSSVVDLTSQSAGWKVSAKTNAKFATGTKFVKVERPAKALKVRFDENPIIAKTMTSKKTLKATCSQYHMCHIQTGTLMMTVTGKCEAKPIIVCNRHIYPCESDGRERFWLCSQWYEFKQKHCKHLGPEASKEECSVSVAVTRENGDPVGFQVFEQRPIEGKASHVYYDYSDSADDSPRKSSDTLSDGSSGSWMVWNPN